MTVEEALEINRHRAWLRSLGAVGPLPGGVELPPLEDAPTLLERLGVADEDAAAVLERWPHPEHDAATWGLIERCAHVLVRDLGGTRWLGWPRLPGTVLYAYVFLAVLARVREWQRRRRIPDDVSWATLADLGRQMRLHRRIHGRSGLEEGDWLSLHFRGGLFELGRLHFNRGRGEESAEALRAAGAPVRRGDWVLDVHIPAAGLLTPEACDASFAAARAFFARHFPEEPYRIATCRSWLLDPQFAEYLPPESNIVRFQRRFRVLPGGLDADVELFRFVFHRTAVALDDVPQETTLERAIVAHLRAGRHWQAPTGWLEL
ncbi:MAG: acyltransferase domain-containing protein [Actinomycetota bacterium]|nr:acyltransferase domain-containing protein [Actinomycetota bacterium]